MLLLQQFPFQLFNQLRDQRLELRLATSECGLMPDRFIARAQIGQHQLKSIDSGVAVQNVTSRARRGYDTGRRRSESQGCFQQGAKLTQGCALGRICAQGAAEVEERGRDADRV